MMRFLSLLVLSIFVLNGCNSGGESLPDTSLGVPSKIQQLGDDTTFLKPGPFKDGQFGRIDLSDVKYANKEPKDILDGAILIDIRNKWEREDPGQAVEADPAIIVYEFRTPARVDDRKNPLFVQEVTQLVNGDKNRKIILICHTGSRSAKAAKLLSENGFTNVYDIKGGFEEWEKYFRTDSYTNIYGQ